MLRNVAHLDVQNDFVAMVSREELLHVGSHTGVTAQGVQAPVRVYFQQDWHSGCVGLHRRRPMVMGVQPTRSQTWPEDRLLIYVI